MGEALEKGVIHPKDGDSPADPSSAKDKEDVGGGGLGRPRGGRPWPWTWTSKCWGSTCLLGQAETVGHREELTDRARFFSVYYTQFISIVIHGNSSFLGTVPLSIVF